MNRHSVSLAAVLVVAIAVTVAVAQPTVTVVLTNGQQYTGSLVGGNDSGITVNVKGRQVTFSPGDIGVIEFSGQEPTSQELQQVSKMGGNQPSFLRNIVSSRNTVLVLQNGRTVSGALGTISSDGNQITLVTPNGQNNYFANDIQRLYTNPSSARDLQNVLAANRNPGAGQPVGTSGQQLTQARTITVPANQPWTPTGISVQQGQRVTFQVSGQIRYSGDPNSAVGPKGGGISQQISEQYPIPTAGVGALIARVGNSQPFLVGDFTQPLTMPASGELYLGINDNIYNDNTGNFTVQIAPAGGQ